MVQEINITQELTFGEASNGAAVVQGVFVGANDDTARNLTMGSSKVVGGMDSRQVTERNGKSKGQRLEGSLTDFSRVRTCQQFRRSPASQCHV